MRTTRKAERALRIALAFIMAFSCVPALSLGSASQAFAQSESSLTALTESDLSTLAEGDVFQAESEGASIYFTVTGDDTVAVGRGNSSGGEQFAVDADFEGELVLPDQVSDGSSSYTVTEIQSYAFGAGTTSEGWTGAQVSSISIPASIQSIDSYAFYGCTALVSVEFAEDGELESIGANAFNHCHSFEGAEIPASVREIERYAFANCTSMTWLSFAEGSQMETVGDHAFAGSKNYQGALESFEFPAVDTIAQSVMAYQTSLVDLTFAGESYLQIEEDAFEYCSSLQTVTIPDLVGGDEAGNADVNYNMDDNCFSYCTSLQTIIFAGDTDDYLFFMLDRNFSPFSGCTSVENVVYMGTKCEWNTYDGDSGQGDISSVFDSVEDPDSINFYYNVTFYDSKTDAEEGVDSVGSVRVLSDVTYAEIKNNTLSEEQVFDDGGYVPEASGVWSFEGSPLDADVIEDSCYAYDSNTSSLDSCTITLGKSVYVCKGSPVELDYTLTSASGEELVEGVDFTASVYLDDEEQDKDDLTEAGDYELVFDGIGDYEDSIETSFSIEWASIDWSILAGQYSRDVAKTVSRGSTTSGESMDTVFVVGEDSADYALACLGAAGLNSSVILITEQDSLSSEVRTQLNRVDANAVVLIGTADDISDDVNTSLNSFNNSGLSVSRLAAEDLADAATRLYNSFADEGLGEDGVAYVVASDDPTLAAAVGVDAYQNARPIFFCGSDGQLDGSTRSALKTGGFDTVIVVSESSSIASMIQSQVGNSSVTFQSLTGTSSQLSAYTAAEQLAGMDLDEEDLDLVIGPASGAEDAALAALYAARSDGCLLLAGDEDEATEAMDSAIGDNWETADSLHFVGRRSCLSQDAVEGVLSYWYDGYTQFSDVSATAWYAAYVNEAVELGLIEGYSDDDGNASGEYGPEDELTRAQVATILWRASGEDTVESRSVGSANSTEVTEGIFDDEADGVWYTDAINWCANSGILYGDGDGKVRPNDSVTREELACMLMRYAEHMGYDVEEDDLPEITGVDEVDEVSSWAVDAMRWVYVEDILVGKASSSGSYLDPQGTATRGQMAKLSVIVNAMTTEL